MMLRQLATQFYMHIVILQSKITVVVMLAVIHKHTPTVKS